MIKLNDNTIFIGQIKQILKNFNLPLCRVGRTFPCANRHFIVKDSIFRWKLNQETKQLEEIFCDRYNYGHLYANLTSNFKVENLIYDRSTHRYLGKYLRFLRDYKGLNLMSMYNCFDSDYYDDKLSFTINDKDINFSSDNDLNFVYKVPISINELTIFTHSMSQVELCLTIDIDNKDKEIKDIKKELAKETYIKKKYNREFYYNPFSFLELSPITDNIANDTEIYTKTKLKNHIVENLDKLCLLVKVPRSLKTSIVVLEGKYTSKPNQTKYYAYKPYNFTTATISDLANSNNLTDNLLMHVLEDDGDYQYLKSLGQPTDSSRTRILDKERLCDVAVSTSYPIFSQLLSFENTTMNYLLGDRLIEYLSGNAITNLSEPYEIKRIQKVLDSKRYATTQTDFNNIIKTAQIDLEKEISKTNIDYNKIEEIKTKFKKDVSKYQIDEIPSIRNNVAKDRFYGIWHYTDLQDLKALQDTYIKSDKQKGKCDIDFYDILGYVDKDFENRIKGDLDNADV